MGRSTAQDAERLARCCTGKAICTVTSKPHFQLSGISDKHMFLWLVFLNHIQRDLTIMWRTVWQGPPGAAVATSDGGTGRVWIWFIASGMGAAAVTERVLSRHIGRKSIDKDHGSAEHVSGLVDAVMTPSRPCRACEQPRSLHVYIGSIRHLPRTRIVAMPSLTRARFFDGARPTACNCSVPVR